MFSLPSSRRYLLPAILLLVVVVLIRSVSQAPATVTDLLLKTTLESQIQHGQEIPQSAFEQYILPVNSNSTAPLGLPVHAFYPSPPTHLPAAASQLTRLFTCPHTPNPHHNHIRLPVLVHNITSLHRSPSQKFNPTLLALPPWSRHRYLLVSRLVTEGLHQESHICLADICHHPNTTHPTSDSIACPDTLLPELVSVHSTLLHCATPPETLNIPPTPASNCSGAWESFPSIPGFHDPRVFWSGAGEPLVVVNSASQYACLGLWVQDLRSVYAPLAKIVERKGKKEKSVVQYRSLTEITKAMEHRRSMVEKNWFLFSDEEASFVHYDITSDRSSHSQSGSGRAFAKLIGNGFTTPNLADPNEAACLPHKPDGQGRWGHWHQSSNALKLILCARKNLELCDGAAKVNFALVHRKFSNEMELPLRYERWFVLWESEAPYRMLARSEWPVVLWNETVGGWSAAENWVVENDDRKNDDGAEIVREDIGIGRNASIILSRSAMGYDRNPTVKNSSPGAGAWKRTFTGTKNTTKTESDPIKRGWEGNIGKPWAYFTYTPSIAWAWRRSDEAHLRNMHVGYLDDEIVLGIGLEDTAQTWARVRADVLLGCLTRCPGIWDGVGGTAKVTVQEDDKEVEGEDVVWAKS